MFLQFAGDNGLESENAGPEGVWLGAAVKVDVVLRDGSSRVSGSAAVVGGLDNVLKSFGFFDVTPYTDLMDRSDDAREVLLKCFDLAVERAEKAEAEEVGS